MGYQRSPGHVATHVIRLQVQNVAGNSRDALRDARDVERAASPKGRGTSNASTASTTSNAMSSRGAGAPQRPDGQLDAESAMASFKGRRPWRTSGAGRAAARRAEMEDERGGRMGDSGTPHQEHSLSPHKANSPKITYRERRKRHAFIEAAAPTQRRKSSEEASHLQLAVVSASELAPHHTRNSNRSFRKQRRPAQHDQATTT